MKTSHTNCLWLLWLVRQGQNKVLSFLSYSLIVTKAKCSTGSWHASDMKGKKEFWKVKRQQIFLCIFLQHGFLPLPKIYIQTLFYTPSLEVGQINRQYLYSLAQSSFFKYYFNFVSFSLSPLPATRYSSTFSICVRHYTPVTLQLEGEWSLRNTHWQHHGQEVGLPVVYCLVLTRYHGFCFHVRMHLWCGGQWIVLLMVAHWAKRRDMITIQWRLLDDMYTM